MSSVNAGYFHLEGGGWRKSPARWALREMSQLFLSCSQGICKRQKLVEWSEGKLLRVSVSVLFPLLESFIIHELFETSFLASYFPHISLDLPLSFSAVSVLNSPLGSDSINIESFE